MSATSTLSEKIVLAVGTGEDPTELVTLAAVTASSAELNILDGVTATAAELNYNDVTTAGVAQATKAMITDANKGISDWRDTRQFGLFQQIAPAAKTTSTTLTAAELLTGIITGNQGAAGAAAYTLPLATSMETELLSWFSTLQNNDAFDFSVINLSTNAAEDITMTTNTGWTLVGNMVITESAAASGANSVGLFRVRRTAANTYTLYRIG